MSDSDKVLRKLIRIEKPIELDIEIATEPTAILEMIQEELQPTVITRFSCNGCGFHGMGRLIRGNCPMCAALLVDHETVVK